MTEDMKWPDTSLGVGRQDQGPKLFWLLTEERECLWREIQAFLKVAESIEAA